MQLMNKLARVLLASSVIVSLGACTHTGKGGSSQQDEMYTANSSQATTSGVGENENYNDSQAHALVAKNTYYFDFDKSDIHEADKPSLYAKADYLISHPNAKIILEGHTDPRGSREYNIGLGERRANAIAELLKSKGVNPTQIRVVSYGAEQLAAMGRTETDYQLDRRAVFAKLQG